MVLKQETKSMADEGKEVKLIASTSATKIYSDVQKKERLEKRAFDALERRLIPQNKMCRTCKGEGYKTDGDTCNMCQGAGFVMEDADMRAIELVLKPKFPTTQINLNADIEGMTTDDLMKFVESM